MNLEQLPQEFLERMEHMLGEEYPGFLQSYEEPRKFGLRVNTMKISVEEFQRLAPFHLTPIPWIPNGFYYEREDDPARHPFYYAGLYYLQEPSAMTPASILPVMQGEHVLDLCAAPGGKATALGAKLAGTARGERYQRFPCKSTAQESGNFRYPEFLCHKCVSGKACRAVCRGI